MKHATSHIKTASARQKSGNIAGSLLLSLGLAAIVITSAGAGYSVARCQYAPYVAELDEIMAVSPVVMLQRIAPELDAEELLRAGMAQLAEAGADEDDIASAIADAREGVQL